VRINAQDVIPLDKVRVDFPSLVQIRVRLNGDFEKRARELSELVRRKPGATSVRLRLENPRDFVLFLDIAEKVSPDREFRSEIERLCGREAYEPLG